MMDKGTKIRSVIELAKYKTGTALYRVVFRPIGLPDIELQEGQEWMSEVHPKVLYERGSPGEACWPQRILMPRLCAVDFQHVVLMLTSEPVVEEFKPVDIIRCQNTGEFYYQDHAGDWMPESMLFTTADAAKREKARIKSLIRKWSEKMAADEV